MEPGKSVTGIKCVTYNEHFFQGHFPGRPVMPGVLMPEAVGQTGGILLLSTFPQAKGKLIFFMGIDAAKFRRPVGRESIADGTDRPPLEGKGFQMAGKAYVGEELAAEGEFTCMVVDS